MTGSRFKVQSLRFKVQGSKIGVFILQLDGFNLIILASVKRFEDLEVWQLARELASENYNETLNEHFAKDFELKSQIRKSSSSTMDNIAEGFERGGKKEFIQFLGISKGSAGEVRSQLYRLVDRKHISQEKADILFEKVTALSKKLSSFITYLKNSEYKGFKFKDQVQP